MNAIESQWFADRAREIVSQWGVKEARKQAIVAMHSPLPGSDALAAELTDEIGRVTQAALANAHLGAASPELYEALEALVEEVVGSVEYSDWPELQKCVERAQTALSKARGEHHDT